MKTCCLEIRRLEMGMLLDWMLISYLERRIILWRKEEMKQLLKV